MKYYKIIAAFLLFFVIVSCRSTGNNESTADTTIIETAISDNIQSYKGMKVVGQRDTFSFDLTAPSFVKMALLVPSDSGNIRINQLIMPNGEMDGPFGKTYNDSLYIPGTYQVIIAESLMQENPYSGAYELKIEMKE